MTPISRVNPKSKSQALQERLSALALSLGAGGKMPTVAQLCETFDVSPRTLNFSLRDLEDQGLIERRNGVGIFVASEIERRITSRVALACDAYQLIRANHSPFWDLLIEQADRRVGARNELFEMHLVGGQMAGLAPIPLGLKEAVEAGQIRAVIGIGLGDEAAAWLEEWNVPVVSFAGAGRAMVYPDTAEFSRQGVAELLARGCRSVGLWRPVPDKVPLQPYVLRAAREQFVLPAKESLLRGGVHFYPELVRIHEELLECGGVMGASGQEQGYELALEVFGGQGMAPDGVLIADDVMATGALAGLRKLGLEPGRDVELVTFANEGSPILVGYEEQVAPFVFAPGDFAQVLFQLLDRLLLGQETGPAMHRVPPRRRGKTEETVELASAAPASGFAPEMVPR